MDRSQEIKFINDYRTNGADATAKKYGITKQSAIKYFYNFKKDVTLDEKSEDVKVPRIDVNNDEGISNNISSDEKYSPILVDEINALIKDNAIAAPSFIRQLAIDIKSYFQSRNAYNTYRKSGRKHKASKETPRFYNGLYKSIVQSLYQLLMVVTPQNDQSTHILSYNHIDESFPFLTSLSFIFDVVSYNYSDNYAIDKKINIVREEHTKRFGFDKPFGINKEWNDIFIESLNKNIGCINYNTANLAKDVIYLIGVK